MKDRITPYEEDVPANQVGTLFQTPMAPCRWKMVHDFALATMPRDDYDYEYISRKETIWQLRDRFLNIRKGDGRELLRFLNDTGQWQQQRGKSGIMKISLSRFWDDQVTLRELLTEKRRTRKVTDWIQELLTAELADHWKPAGLEIGINGVPSVNIVIAHTRPLLFLSVWQDLVAQSKFRYCARRDCPTHKFGTAPFRLKSNHKKIYCSTKCAQLEMVRRFRSKRKPQRSNNGNLQTRKNLLVQIHVERAADSRINKTG